MNSKSEEQRELKRLEFVVEDKRFMSTKQFLLGLEIKGLTGIPKEAKLYMQNRSPWEDNLIQDDEEVDLARPGIEYFFVEKRFDLIVNVVNYSWRQRFILGRQVRELAVIPEGEVLLLRTSNTQIDQVVGDDDKVDLLQPGIENFYSRSEDRQITLVISGVAKSWSKKKISFREVVILAYGTYDDSTTMIYTVAYEDGPRQNPEGSMVKGVEVFTKDKMIFHATATNQS
jgi:hypothetical protein